MAGIGGQEAAGKLVTVQTTLPGDIDGITDAVRQIMLLGEVQAISIKNGEPITYQRFVRDGEEALPQETTQSFAELTPLEVVRNISMEEWSPAAEVREAKPIEKLFWMFLHMASRRWVVTHLIVGESTEFWQWLGLPNDMHEAVDQFLGARIERDKMLPSEAFILCGSRTRSATIAEVGYALKGNTFEVIDEAAN